MKKILLFLVLLMPMLASAATIKAGDWFKDYTPEGYLMQFVAYTNVDLDELCCMCATGNPGYSSCISAAYGKVTIPSYAKGLKVTHIQSQAFNGLDGMTELVIPSTVMYVSTNIIQDCFYLTKVTCNATIPPTVSGSGFIFGYSTEDYATLYVPKGCVSKYQSAKGWKNFKTIKEIGADDGLEINATNFPDDNFRNWILSQDYGKDGVLTDAEIANVTTINVSEENIQSLQGIEFFTALTRLDCYTNQLTSLDVSNNTVLTYLNCKNNQLTSFDVSKNTALTNLYCFSNQLTSLDVSKNTALTTLNCHTNQLTSLDVSKNTALTWLSCGSNQLTSLDVSKNTALTYLSFNYNQLTSLDVSKNTMLTSLHCENNQLTSLDVSKNTKLTYLDCYSNQIKGTAMDALVASLPTVSNREMRVICNENEGNVMTTTQVATAKAKGWTPQYTTLNGVYWQEYAGSEPVPMEKCATPTISFVDGKLEFSCETEGVEFVTNITSSDSGDYEGNSIPLTSTYIVSVYAKKAGYADSDVATEEITAGGTTGIRGDVNGDNEVGMPDVMYIVNYILNSRFPDENLQSPRVRFGIFETVAGYSVAINSINVDYNLTIGTDAIGSALNTTASNPTWDTANGEYSAVQPNEANTNMMLIKLDYTLTSEDGSGENIVVRNAEVEVPAEVLKWQSNKDYTYIMKIGDNPDWKPTMKLAELFPITLWGVEIKENSNNVTR